jgi:hypothetical protein
MPSITVIAGRGRLLAAAACSANLELLSEARSFDPTILVPPDDCVAVLPRYRAATIVRVLLWRPEMGADERWRQPLGGRGQQ